MSSSTALVTTTTTTTTTPGAPLPTLEEIKEQLENIYVIQAIQIRHYECLRQTVRDREENIRELALLSERTHSEVFLRMNAEEQGRLWAARRALKRGKAVLEETLLKKREMRELETRVIEALMKEG
ncbi:hypothetical protein MMC24_000536 [Lignoscripta atroalba]|nr:hypothetical protein [Lignoscripta atroalba]